MNDNQSVPGCHLQIFTVWSQNKDTCRCVDITTSPLAIFSVFECPSMLLKHAGKSQKYFSELNKLHERHVSNSLEEHRATTTEQSYPCTKGQLATRYSLLNLD